MPRTKIKKEVLCPYCKKEATLTSSEAIYGKHFGMIYLCYPCDAWVGVHKDTDHPLGTLANAELRDWRKWAHKEFDPIWQKRFEEGSKTNPRYKKAMARGGRYKRLSILMEIPMHQCHIGMFDVDQCKEVVRLCQAGLVNPEAETKKPESKDGI